MHLRCMGVMMKILSEEKCIYPYQADNRDGRKNIGGWGKDCRTNKSEK